MSSTLRRLSAFSVTKFFLLSSLLSVVLACSGCGQSEKSKKNDREATPTTPVIATLPANPSEAPLYLLHEYQTVAPGGDPDDALKVYPKPQRAFQFSDLPGFLAQDFEAKGWETASESFGLILKNKQIALAIETHENTDDERLESIVRTYRAKFGVEKAKLEKAHAAYWFWESGTLRLMICSAKDRKGQKVTSVAVGDKSLMTSLRMDPDIAERDILRSLELLSEDRGK